MNDGISRCFAFTFSSYRSRSFKNFATTIGSKPRNIGDAMGVKSVAVAVVSFSALGPESCYPCIRARALRVSYRPSLNGGPSLLFRVRHGIHYDSVDRNSCGMSLGKYAASKKA